jgi:hypothetical protein
LKGVEKWGMGSKERVMEGFERTKVKHTHSGHTLRHPCEQNLSINNKNKDCNIGSMCVCEGVVLVTGGRVKERD